MRAPLASCPSVAGGHHCPHIPFEFWQGELGREEGDWHSPRRAARWSVAGAGAVGRGQWRWGAQGPLGGGPGACRAVSGFWTPGILTPQRGSCFTRAHFLLVGTTGEMFLNGPQRRLSSLPTVSVGKPRSACGVLAEHPRGRRTGWQGGAGSGRQGAPAQTRAFCGRGRGKGPSSAQHPATPPSRAPRRAAPALRACAAEAERGGPADPGLPEGVWAAAEALEKQLSPGEGSHSPLRGLGSSGRRAPGLTGGPGTVGRPPAGACLGGELCAAAGCPWHLRRARRSSSSRGFPGQVFPGPSELRDAA